MITLLFGSGLGVRDPRPQIGIVICLFCFICSCYGARPILAVTTCLELCPTLGARRGPTKHLPCLLYLLRLWRAACPRSECSVADQLAGARRGPTKHLPCLLYLLLLWRTACPRSERSVGGPAHIALMLDFGASRPVCKRAPQAGGRLVILSRMVTHAVTSLPKTAKMRMRSAAS